LAIKLVKLITPQIALKVAQMYLPGRQLPKVPLDDSVSIDVCAPEKFFSLAFQIGLVTSLNELNEKMEDNYEIRLPNQEISLFLKNKMLEHFLGDEKEFAKIFELLRDGSLGEFDILLSNFITNRLPLLGTARKSAQNNTFILMMAGLKLGLEYDCSCDSCCKCMYYMAPKHGVIILLNSAESKRGVSFAASRALRTEYGYVANWMKNNSSSFFTIGIGVFRNCASVITESHEA
jgi:hypothetical protein